jgi:RimJ/RimL family protein N-acetyltransferase
MIPLKPEAYPHILALIRGSEIRSHLALAHALLEGRQDGVIYGNDATRPTTALVCPVSGFWFAFGDVGNGAAVRFLPRLLRSPLPDKPALYATSAAWREALDPLFESAISRPGFDWEPTPEQAGADPAPSLADGFELALMDARVADLWSEGLDPWVIDIWDGPERFAAACFGFAVMHEGRIVSFCTACGIGGGEAEVEIGTVPRFRRMGLATAAARAFLSEYGRRGLRPAWSHDGGNEGSGALGRGLGFRQIEVLRGYLPEKLR